MYFRMYAGKSKNPEPTIVPANASTVFRWMDRSGKLEKLHKREKM